MTTSVEKYHMKMLWDFGESIEWKQGPFKNRLNCFSKSHLDLKLSKVESIMVDYAQQTVSEVVGTNHKGHTDLVFQGLSVTNARFHILTLEQYRYSPYRHQW